MLAFLANLFGYILNFFYNFLGNYGLAIILFCVLIKILMLPLSIKQQRTQQKTLKLQTEMKQIQFKYKNDPEKMNAETMNLYKREKMSPFSGCLVAIIQMILLFAVFYMVKEPLTYMKKVDADVINDYVNVLSQENLIPSEAYSQIAVISEVDKIKDVKTSQIESENPDNKEELLNQLNDNLDKVRTNMNFLGIDLSKVPTQSMNDYKVYIIPLLYVISSFISIKMSTAMQTPKKKDDVIEVKKVGKDGKEESNEVKKVEKEEQEVDATAQMNKTMSWFMPVMAVSISLIAPLGLALYWLTNNVLMIGERLVLNKVLKDEEE